jgi:hypothetical protein
MAVTDRYDAIQAPEEGVTSLELEPVGSTASSGHARQRVQG